MFGFVSNDPRSEAPHYSYTSVTFLLVITARFICYVCPCWFSVCHDVFYVIYLVLLVNVEIIIQQFLFTLFILLNATIDT